MQPQTHQKRDVLRLALKERHKNKAFSQIRQQFLAAQTPDRVCEEIDALMDPFCQDHKWHLIPEDTLSDVVLLLEASPRRLRSRQVCCLFDYVLHNLTTKTLIWEKKVMLIYHCMAIFGHLAENSQFMSIQVHSKAQKFMVYLEQWAVEISENGASQSELVTLELIKEASILLRFAIARFQPESLSTQRDSSDPVEIERKRQLERKRREENLEKQIEVGNIRLFCRLRPQPVSQKIQFTPNSVLLLKDQDKTWRKAQKAQTSYKFERVFAPMASQQEVFEELEGMIKCCLIGKDIGIMAFGATGSGKSHTMLGQGSSDQEGILWRTIRLLFREIGKLDPRIEKPEISIEISEIYKEEKVNLCSKSRNTDPKTQENKKQTPVIVACESEAIKLVSRCVEARVSAATSQNSRSSRSHFILNIYLTLSDKLEPGQKVKGSITLVDFAGSKKVENEERENERTQLIHFTDALISKATNKSNFVKCALNDALKPLLQPGGLNAMILTVSPLEEQLAQTKKTLAILNDVSKVLLNKKKK